jgi:hypothetical protein
MEPTERDRERVPAPVVQKHVKLEGVVTNPGKGDQILTVGSRVWVAWKRKVKECWEDSTRNG